MWGLLGALENVSYPGWAAPALHALNTHAHALLAFVDQRYAQWLSWVFTPIVVAFLLPLVLLVFIYGCAIWLHLFRIRRQIVAGFSEGPWEGARSAIAGFWDAQGYIWHGYEVEGLEQLPEKGPALIVYYHGALPIDVYYLLAKAILHRRRSIRCVGDRFLFRIPGFRLLCEVFFITPGSIASCVEELRTGHMLSVSPGGVREALFSSDYELLWGARLGFAKVALQARCPIIPMATENLRESFRTPALGRSFFRWLYEKTRLPLMPIYGGFPVKLRTRLGPPIHWPYTSQSPESPLTDRPFLSPAEELPARGHAIDSDEEDSGGDSAPLLSAPSSPRVRGLGRERRATAPEGLAGPLLDLREPGEGPEEPQSPEEPPRRRAQGPEPLELRELVEAAVKGLVEQHQVLPGSVLRALLDRVPQFRPYLASKKKELTPPPQDPR